MKSVVYFLRTTDRIKIGISTNLRLRVYNLSLIQGEQLHVVGAILGGYLVEKALHKQLEAFATEENEWFHADDVVLGVVNHIVSRFKGAFGEAAFAFTDSNAILPSKDDLSDSAFVKRAEAHVEFLIQSARAEGFSSPEAMEIVAEWTGLPVSVIRTVKYRKPTFITASSSALLAKHAEDRGYQPADPNDTEAVALLNGGAK